MSLANARPSEKYVPSYQVSGKPFVQQVSVATTATQLVFPSVTRWIKITNATSSDIQVGFSKEGIDGTEHDYWYTIPGISKADENSTGVWELRCKEIWLKSSSGTQAISVVAGLTDIGNLVTALTGSVGVG